MKKRSIMFHDIFLPSRSSEDDRIAAMTPDIQREACDESFFKKYAFIAIITISRSGTQTGVLMMWKKGLYCC